MKVSEVEAGTVVKDRRGDTLVIGNIDKRTDVFAQGFSSVKDYENNENTGMIRLDAEVTIV